jgi:hypothetical protein
LHGVVPIVRRWFCLPQPPGVISSTKADFIGCLPYMCVLLTKVDYEVFKLEVQVSPPGGVVCVLFYALPSFAHPMFSLGVLLDCADLI